MTAGIPDFLEQKAYPRKRSQPYLICLFLVLLGVVLDFSRWKAIYGWIGGGEFPAKLFSHGFSLSLLLSGLGVFLFICILRGLPRLTVNREGITLELALGKQRAAWGSITGFRLKDEIYATKMMPKESRSLIADIIGRDVSRNLSGKKTFVIPDGFKLGVDELVQDLNAYRAQALAGLTRHTQEDVAHRQQEAEAKIAAVKWPDIKQAWLTHVILIFLIAVYIAQWLFAVDPAPRSMEPSIRTLLALGALNKKVILESGEWYRFITATCLHGNIVHLLGNGLALFLGGVLLEKMVGRSWFLSIYIIAALGGSLASYTFNPAITTSVGASGAIMGLFAAVYVLSFRSPDEVKRHELQVASLRLLIPSLLPLASSSGQGIDIAAHAGGLVAGALVAWALLKTWPAASPLPKGEILATGGGVFGVILIAGAFMGVADHYAGTKLILTSYIPQSEMPKKVDEAMAKSRDFLIKYPEDPRSHFFRALALNEGKDPKGSIQEFQIAMAKLEAMRYVTGDAKIEEPIRTAYAAMLLQEGQDDEARAVIQPFCGKERFGKLSEMVRKLIMQENLCTFER